MKKFVTDYSNSIWKQALANNGLIPLPLQDKDVPENYFKNIYVQLFKLMHLTNPKQKYEKAFLNDNPPLNSEMELILKNYRALPNFTADNFKLICKILIKNNFLPPVITFYEQVEKEINDVTTSPNRGALAKKIEEPIRELCGYTTKLQALKTQKKIEEKDIKELEEAFPGLDKKDKKLLKAVALRNLSCLAHQTENQAIKNLVKEKATIFKQELVNRQTYVIRPYPRSRKLKRKVIIAELLLLFFFTLALIIDRGIARAHNREINDFNRTDNIVLSVVATLGILIRCCLYSAPCYEVIKNKFNRQNIFYNETVDKILEEKSDNHETSNNEKGDLEKQSFEMTEKESEKIEIKNNDEEIPLLNNNRRNFIS